MGWIEVLLCNKKGVDIMDEEIWALEHDWYGHHCDGEPEKAYALLHENFMGWPTVDSSVIDGPGMIDLITEEDKDIASCEFALEDPRGVQVVGDTAINHYKVRFLGKYNDGSDLKEVLHVAHTWVKEDGDWKLLSGMAYEVE